MSLFESLENHLLESKWSADVKTKKHPPEGLFASGTEAEITSWLIKSHGDNAIDALNFYINRAGKNLSDDRKDVLDKVKDNLANKD